MSANPFDVFDSPASAGRRPAVGPLGALPTEDHLRRAVQFTPEENADNVARETSPSAQAELLSAIDTEIDPRKKAVLADTYWRDFGDAPTPNGRMLRVAAAPEPMGRGARQTATVEKNFFDQFDATDDLSPDALIKRARDSSTTAGDYGKSVVQGALQGAGAIFQGGGELLARGVNKIAGTELRSVNLLQGAIDALEESKSPGAKKLVAESQMSGELLKPSTWEFGSNPTARGLALQGLNAIGQFAPNLAIALTTAGASIPTQLGIGATVGGLQGLGAGSGEERDRFLRMNESEISSASTLYRELRAKGVDRGTAQKAVAEAAALGGGLGNAIPSAAEGAFENFLVGALTRGRVRIPSLPGMGRAGSVAAGAVGGAAVGGSEEASSKPRRTSAATLRSAETARLAPTLCRSSSWAQSPKARPAGLQAPRGRHAQR